MQNRSSFLVQYFGELVSENWDFYFNIWFFRNFYFCLKHINEFNITVYNESINVTFEAISTEMFLVWLKILTEKGINHFMNNLDLIEKNLHLLLP